MNLNIYQVYMNQNIYIYIILYEVYSMDILRIKITGEIIKRHHNPKQYVGSDFLDEFTKSEFPYSMHVFHLV